MQEPFQPRHLAIVYPKAIGDFIFILPALHTLRRDFPDTRITLVVKRKQAPLAAPQKGTLVDEVLLVDAAGWRGVRRHLAEQRVDTVVDMAGNDQAGLILAWRGGRRLRPHRHDCKGFCALYSPFAKAFPPLQRGMHRVDELLAFARALGTGDPLYSFKLELPDQAVAASEEMIATHSLRNGTLIALNIGASRDTKRWPAEAFGRLARLLLESGYRIALTGGRLFRADDHYDRRIVDQFIAEGWVDGEHCINLVSDHELAPDLQLQRDTHFLRYSGVPAVVVGNDTGPMHIAGAVGDDARNRTVSLFGPTNWGRYAPYDPTRSFPDQPLGQWNHVLCIHADCGPAGTREACPCYRRGCPHKRCMQTIEPERVMEAITSMVKPT